MPVRSFPRSSTTTSRVSIPSAAARETSHPRCAKPVTWSRAARVRPARRSRLTTLRESRGGRRGCAGADRGAAGARSGSSTRTIRAARTPSSAGANGCSPARRDRRDDRRRALSRFGELVLPGQRRDRRAHLRSSLEPDLPRAARSSTVLRRRDLRALLRLYGAAGLRDRGERRAVAEARANARLNGLEERVRFVAARVEGALGRGRHAGAARGRDRVPRSAAQRHRRSDAVRARGRRRAGNLVSLVRPGDARPGFAFLAAKGIPARRRAAVRHVPADRPRRDARHAHRRAASCKSSDYQTRRNRNRPLVRTIRRSTFATSPSSRASRLTDDEVERFGAQLGDLLAHVNALAAARHLRRRGDRAGRRVAQRRARRRRRARASIAKSCLPQAPQRQGGFFRVPRIIAEDE